MKLGLFVFTLVLAGCTTQAICEAEGGAWVLKTSRPTNHCYDHKHNKEIVVLEGYCDVRQVYGCMYPEPVIHQL